MQIKRLLLFVLAATCFSVTTVRSQTISGQTNVTAGASYSYHYNGSVPTGSYWNVSGGTITSQQGQNVTVVWSSSYSSGTLGLYEDGGIAPQAQSQQQFRPIGGLIASLSVTISSAIPIPARPPNPTTTAHSCSNTQTLTRSGSSPSGITWYWQGKNSSGTSTSNSSATYTATSSGRYYIRARNNIGTWSTSSGYVDVTIDNVPGMPTAPSVSEQCGQTVLTRSNPPSGETWYWQTSSGGTSTGNASQSWTRTSGGTVYLRARNNSSGCWSGSRTVTYSVNVLPGTPSAPSVSNQCGQTVLTRSNPPSGETWYWQTSASGTSTSNSSQTWARTTSGTVCLRAKEGSCWSTARTINVTINEQPGEPGIADVTVNCDNTVITRASPPANVTWYWQGTNSNGTNTTNASTTYTANASGTYYLRGYHDNSDCWGISTISRITWAIPALYSLQSRKHTSSH